MGALAPDPAREAEKERVTFRAFLRSLGLHPRTIAPDGKWRRCPTESHPKKRNGAYKLAPDGRIGFAQDWATMTEPAVWRAGKETDLPEVDVLALRRAQQEHEAAVRRAIQEARAFYGRCEVLRGGHPYLEAHGLGMAGCGGLRVDQEGWLVIPAYHGRNIQSVQRIAPDGAKRFWPGAPVGGTRYTIGRGGGPEALTVLCEGFATGAACYTALLAHRRPARVVVLWDAGNLERAAKETPGWKVIAADNDHETEARTGRNPGLQAAQVAAEQSGAGIAYPTGIQGTDWADLAQERRAERLIRMGPHETRGGVEREVQAEIARELERQAKYVVRRAVG